jgi:FkbM family methyltransferase
VTFRENDVVQRAMVPNDSLWNAVKDNLILLEYERAGLSLCAFRGVVVDAGAHVGLFSMRAAVYASQVISLEPDPANHELLRRNVQTNSHHNVDLIPMALWSSKEIVDLHSGSHSAAGSILGGGNTVAHVPTITLDEIAARVNHIDLLKLDIEGAEFPVLEQVPGDVLEKVGTIVAELHTNPDDDCRPQLFERLRSMGFTVSVLPPPIFSPREGLVRVFSSWQRVRGLLRLKLSVLGVYGAFALILPIVRRLHPEFDGLSFLYATKSLSGGEPQ